MIYLHINIVCSYMIIGSYKNWHIDIDIIN